MRTACIYAIVAFLVMVPASTFAAHDSELEVAGWIPYWAKTDGAKSALKNLNTLDAIYPFVYTVKSDGTLHDNGNINGREWKKLFREARKKEVDIIPTIMTGNRELIEPILIESKMRNEHIKEIVRMVEKGKFDGVDIDYENRSKASVNEFSIFLKDLKKELGDKKLVCTLEARTPPESLWKVPPSPLPYSNDYDEIEKHCDVIQIMTYDQQRADIKLNEERSGKPYFPNADREWVEKVVAHTVKQLPAEKLMLGVPTYGRHVAVTVKPNWFNNYSGIGAVNEGDALDIAKENKVKPSVNDAGEKVVTYIPKGTPKKTADAIKKMKVPRGTTTGMKAALQALAYADKTGETVTVNMVWWSDAPAIEEKVDIAKEYGLKGIAIFKIDGEEDRDMWKLFK